MKKQPTKEEMKAMVADEYYDHLILKKSGKALRKSCFDATDKFMASMEKLRYHR